MSNRKIRFAHDDIKILCGFMHRAGIKVPEQIKSAQIVYVSDSYSFRPELEEFEDIKILHLTLSKNDFTAIKRFFSFNCAALGRSAEIKERS